MCPESGNRPRLRRLDLLRIFLRSFLIQASWNYQGMLNLGFLFAIMPGLDRLYDDRKDRVKAAIRHAGFFNTHPYMASYALGATLAAEEEAIGKGDEKAFQEVIRLKRSLCGPLGSLGDHIVWGRWRPMCAVIGVFGAALWGGWGPLIFLVLYNILHLGIRYRGIRVSYKDRLNFIDELSGPVYRLLPVIGERAGSFIMGGLVVTFVGFYGSFTLPTRLAFLAGLLVTSYLLRTIKRFQASHGALFVVWLSVTLFGASHWSR